MKSVSINSISQLHDYLQLPRPSHPLISVYPHNALQGKIKSGVQYTFGLYQVSLKDGLQCVMGYGRSHYDFDDGSMVFMSPGQSASVDNVQSNTSTKGWTIAFHPDFIKQGVLGKNINQYHFFEYACNESLHLSEKECQVVTDISKEIEYELSQSMDRHTQTLLQSRLALLFNYCVRFYDRQFYVRADLNQSYVDRFEQLLIDYYRSDKPLEQGIPSVQYCGKALALSPYYL
ncbi:hypothetical protein [Psychromonas sp. GE-S-Ul-11]|uniref:hypothetical protein n=1 Tax=Psychromonas sp. GE-S-Ul-11 TaxID=3241170 RepID=UPI00390CA98A